MSSLSAEQQAALFDAAPVALLVFDADLRMVHANRVYCEAVGLDLSELVGRQIFDVFGGNPSPEGRAQVEALMHVVRRAVDRVETQTLTDFRFDIPADGGFERRRWNVTEVPLPGPDGHTELVLHYTEDITEFADAREAHFAGEELRRTLEQQVARAHELLRARNIELEGLNETLQVTSAHDRSIAALLQHALLGEPRAVPRYVGLQTVYRPAADQVGGDWHDVLDLPGATSIVIGDVVGHDLQAATRMGELRSMLRALSWSHRATPAALLAQLDRAMLDLRLGTIATALVATIEEPASEQAPVEMIWTSAGHPPPMMIGPDGVVGLLDPGGIDTLLGVDPTRPRHDTRTTLPRGSQVLLYTDGLIERRGEVIDDGLGRLFETLTETCRRHGRVPALEDLVDAMVPGAHEDDVAAALLDVPV